MVRSCRVLLGAHSKGHESLFREGSGRKVLVSFSGSLTNSENAKP